MVDIVANNPDYKQLLKYILSHKYYPISIISVFFLILIAYFIAWPIVMLDTDPWYHLSGGRYLWQNGTIAKDAFFSYVAPPKYWYNYYWLFQAVIYKIYEWTDYYGLIVLRCLIYFLTALFIFLNFIRQVKNRTELTLSLFLSVTCTLLILHRELAVRPHLFSYLFIIVFLYLLEFKQEKMWLLPIFGLIWANVHGIEYPVMYLIVFAYLTEIYYRVFRKVHVGSEVGKRDRWLLIFVFYAIFFTPGVTDLVQTPFSISFENAAYQRLYVSELLPIPFRSFFVFAPVSTWGLINALQNLIIFITAGTFLMLLWKRKIRISHTILFAGAFLLLARHGRFTCEFTLLSIPILSCGVRLIAEKISYPRLVTDITFPVIAVLFPVVIFHGIMGNRPVYPFSISNLPTGIVRFLNGYAPGGGRILNEPNTGGYLPWALKPGFKIYMDMQMTIFSDLDFATVMNAFFDANAFRAFISKYDPSFISVSLTNSDFKKIVATDDRFVPVFFDQAEVLYVNKSHYGDLAEQYALKAVDPFHYWEIIYANEKPERLSAIFSEAMRIFEQDPENYRANHILSSIYVVRRQYEKAMFHAEAIIRNYPEFSHGYALKGDAYFGMRRYEDAARFYKKALDMGRTAKSENVYWNLHASYYNLKEYEKAYSVLSKYVNPFSADADYREIYQLGMSAESVGKTREAIKFLSIAKIKVPPADKEYVQKIDKNLGMLNEDSK
jgi:tetratricopeptide (TPR) repeat protein